MSPHERFLGQKFITLETYAKDGKAIRTPVFVVEDGGRVYVRTDPRTGKVKRIMSNSRVRIVPSDGRGAPRGDWLEGEARLVGGPEAVRILELFKKKYGFFGMMTDSFNRLRGRKLTTVISITLR